MCLGRIDVYFVLCLLWLLEAKPLQLLHVMRVRVAGRERLLLCLRLFAGGLLRISQLKHFLLRDHAVVDGRLALKRLL